MKKLFLISILTICYLTNYSQDPGKFTDPRDGKTYKSVKIGNQIWMAENLAYKASSGCWVYNDDQSNVAKYGYLYNWATAKTVCPTGWHLPSDNEWTTLVNNLGGQNVAGGKMKATTGWNNPNNGATNESGFTALPAGNRGYSEGSFLNMGTNTNFWSSTPSGSDYAWLRTLDYYCGKVGRYYLKRTCEYSVRCAKD